MMSTVFETLLKMGRGKLAKRHIRIIKLTLVLSSLEMELDALIEDIIDNWLERRTENN